MANFDPDAFLAQPAAPAAFDPDAFLKQPAAPAGGDVLPEGAKGLARGAIHGLTSLPDLPTAPLRYVEGAARLGAHALGTDLPAWAHVPSVEERIGAPTVSALGAERGKDISTPAKYAATAGEFFGNPVSYFGPGGFLAKAAMTGASAVGSEAAGQLAEGTPWEKPARIAGSLLGGPLAARAIKPRLGADQQALADAGITQMTPGQMFPGVAGVIKGLEDKATSIPILGSFIAGGRRRSIEGFNRAVADQALAPIGERVAPHTEAGHDMVAEVEQRLGNAYDGLLPRLNYVPDRQFATDLASIRNRDVAVLPQPQIEQFERILDTRLGPPAPMSGPMLKTVESEINHIASNYLSSSDAAQRGLGQALQGVLGAIRSNLERANPDHAAELARINSGWAMFARMRDAASRRVAGEGVFSPSDLLAAVKSGDKSVRKGAFARGDALMQEFAETGQRVLPSKVADSGTPGRAMAAGLLGAGAPFAPKIAAGLATTIPPYTRPGMWLLNRWAAPTTGPRAAYRAAAEGAVPSARSILQATMANPTANPYAAP